MRGSDGDKEIKETGVLVDDNNDITVGDGTADLYTFSRSGLSIFFAEADGSFDNRKLFPFRLDARVLNIQDFDGDGDADVLATVGTGFSGKEILVIENLSQPPLSLDANGDDVPDECFLFRRGDVTQDGVVDISDAVALARYISGLEPVGCPSAGDANDDGILNTADPIRILSYLFLGRAAPPPPFPSCGPDPTGGDLPCPTPPPCP